MFISSDTNIWIDFFEIKHLEHPFLLNYEYYISSDAFKDELIKPKELQKTLLQLGLQLANISEKEFTMAITFRKRYSKLSLYDSIALVIAKNRCWTLLTGDNPLRKAAECEGVECHGVIWIYDELLRQCKISSYDYYQSIQALLNAVKEGRCRLPIDELKKRLKTG